MEAAVRQLKGNVRKLTNLIECARDFTCQTEDDHERQQLGAMCDHRRRTHL